ASGRSWAYADVAELADLDILEAYPTASLHSSALPCREVLGGPAPRLALGLASLLLHGRCPFDQSATSAELGRIHALDDPELGVIDARLITRLHRPALPRRQVLGGPAPRLALGLAALLHGRSPFDRLRPTGL